VFFFLFGASILRSIHAFSCACFRATDLTAIDGLYVAGGGDDSLSVAASILSHAPSLHPSLAASGVALSRACSETTIGAGDQTAYWDFQHRTVAVTDLGHRCRECKLPFERLGDAVCGISISASLCALSDPYHCGCFQLSQTTTRFDFWAFFHLLILAGQRPPHFRAHFLLHFSTELHCSFFPFALALPPSHAMHMHIHS
jgi:hypothetical protein